jgi:hypothetical protein
LAILEASAGVVAALFWAARGAAFVWMEASSAPGEDMQELTLATDASRMASRIAGLDTKDMIRFNRNYPSPPGLFSFLRKS